MNRRIRIAAAGAAVVAVAVAPTTGAQAFTPDVNGPHGCFLQDAGGHSLPNLHSSDTSVIGGNSCTITQVATNDPSGDGGDYFAAAQSWSIKVCHPGVDSLGHPICTPAAGYGSAAGSAPIAQHVIRPGDRVSATVSNGILIVGTFNGAPGA